MSSTVVRFFGCIVLFLLCCTLFASVTNRSSLVFSFDSFLNKLSDAPILVFNDSVPRILVDEDWGVFNWFKNFVNTLWSFVYAGIQIMAFITTIITFVFWFVGSFFF